MPIKDLCRQHGSSEASYYLWCSRFGGISEPDAKQLKGLEAENARLKKLLAEQVFENDVIKDALKNRGDRTGAQVAGAEHAREGDEQAACVGGCTHERQRAALRAKAGLQR